MARERNSGTTNGSFDKQKDGILCFGLLAACLAYDVCTGLNFLSWFNGSISDFAGRPVGRDFVNYWTAGVAVFDGMIPEIFAIELFHPYQEQLLGHEFNEHNWSYPPHMLLLVWPFGLLPYLWALAVWTMLTFGLYLWAAAAGRKDCFVVAMALMLAPATYANVTGGQNGFLTAALLIGGLRLLGPRPVLAGILFGILTVKPQLGLLLPFALAASRKWTAIAAASATAVGLFATSILFFGWESWEAYIDLVIPLQSEIMNERQGWFLMMMPSAHVALRLLEVDPVTQATLQGGFSILALVGVAWTFARSQDQDLRFGVLAVGAFLASPYCFNYDMTTLSLVVVLIVLRGLREGFLPYERLVLTATWLLPVAVLYLNYLNAPVAPLVLLACFVCLLIRVHNALQSGACTADPASAGLHSAMAVRN